MRLGLVRVHKGRTQIQEKVKFNVREGWDDLVSMKLWENCLKQIDPSSVLYLKTHAWVNVRSSASEFTHTQFTAIVG